jgi:outer membrane murein-binding lipoprotein Lpp
VKYLILGACLISTGCASTRDLNTLHQDVDTLTTQVQSQRDRITWLERDNAVLNDHNTTMMQQDTQTRAIIQTLTVQVGVLLGITAERPRDNVMPPPNLHPPVVIGD